MGERSKFLTYEAVAGGCPFATCLGICFICQLARLVRARSVSCILLVDKGLRTFICETHAFTGTAMLVVCRIAVNVFTLNLMRIVDVLIILRIGAVKSGAEA